MRYTSLLTAGLAAICLLAGCATIKSLGHNPAGSDLTKLQSLPNYKNGGFQNLTSRPVAAAGAPVVTSRRHRNPLLFMLRSRRESIKPSYGLPWVKTDLKNLQVSAPTIIWFGHSSLLIKGVNATILIDPIFSNNAGPLPMFVRAFQGSKHYKTKHMPDIDVVIISHDHYDHMDYRTLMSLKGRVKKFVVPLGVGSHLRYWGIDAQRITELNWNESLMLPGNLVITATPAQHRSNRTFKEQNKTLWASYVINLDSHQLFYSGDGGYGDHFKQIGNQYGPFDIALLECGQYSSNWPYTHMMPWQTAQAAVDLKARMLQPVHWAKFAESDHAWNDPVKLLLPAAYKLGIQVNIPSIGQPYTIGSKAINLPWWNFE